MRKNVVVWAAVIGTLGCGGEAADPTALPPPPPVATPETPPAGETPPTGETPPGAETTPAAPVVAPTLAELTTTVPAVVPAPVPQTGGPITLTATVCTLDGPPIIGDDSFRSIGPAAWASDGSLYVLDHEARLRRYTIAPGEACVLTMDTTLGDGGRLSLGEGLGHVPESLVADAHGHVFVSSAMHGTDRITGTTVDYHCDATRGDLTVAPSGTDGFTVFGSGPIRRVTFTDAGCTVADWAATDMFESVDSVSFVDATHVLVGGHASASSSPHLARIYGVDGTPAGAAFGDTTGALSADDHFCHVHGAVSCGERLCVLDGNCRSLRVFGGSDHAIVAELDLSHLVGVTYPWFSGLSEVRDGTAYLTVIQQRGAAHPRPDIYDGFVVRVSGL